MSDERNKYVARINDGPMKIHIEMIAYGMKLYKIGYWIPDKDLGSDA